MASLNQDMCHPTPHASKNVESRPSRNSTKFDMVPKFREMISIEKSVLSFDIYKKFWIFYRNYDFAIFEKIGIFSGLTFSPP